MIRISSIFGALMMLSGISLILFSRSKKNYQRLVADGGEKHAAQATKYVRLGGVASLICGAILLLLTW
jgi:hypothetical protein